MIFAALLVALLAMAANAQDIDGALNTTSDVNGVLSQSHDRNVMLIFDQDSCVYCDLFKQNVLSDKAVQKELNDSFIVVMLISTSILMLLVASMSSEHLPVLFLIQTARKSTGLKDTLKAMSF